MRLLPPFPEEDCHCHREALDEAIKRLLDGGQYIFGAEVAAFEEEFIGARHVIGVASGTDAIELLLRALEIGRGAKVVVPSLTATATAAGVLRSGAGALLTDCETEILTQPLHPYLSEEAITAVCGVVRHFT